MDVEGENKRGYIAPAENDGRHGRLYSQQGRGDCIGDALIAVVCLCWLALTTRGSDA